MALVNTSGIHHLRLAVTDLDRAMTFYRDLLGFGLLAESEGCPADPALHHEHAGDHAAGVVLQANGMPFGLRLIVALEADPALARPGLDHLSFAVDSLDELAAAVERLDAAGVAHGEITRLDEFGIAIVYLNDPDGIHLELAAPL